MYNNDFLEKQLSHKKRSVTDLSRFIQTKAGKSANFTLLLGAGCSVSSGIRPATKLTEDWARDLYHDLTEDSKESSIEKIREWLRTNAPDWYNQDHEYSCLFEKRFDLPSQRRAFVEEEVAGKFPSLGYAYLIRLIEKGYFNTVFTTNFDDLLNESFHLFASRRFGGPNGMTDVMRPIVCAHDSSIKSVSISSVRPKIVKLHGDYLFDDIKSTLRETESLQNNICDKFVEFCKEFGLIVVGYSGNDRSVMDVLNYLLRSDDYLKNGVYWCLRQADEISDELKKFLWKDRVYYVYVDGFDELFAELYNNLIPDKELPVSVGAWGLNNQVLETLAANEFLQQSKSSIIQRDIKQLNEENKKNSFFNEIKSVIFGEGVKDNARGLTNEQTVKLIEIDRCLEKNQFERALELIACQINSGIDLTYEYKVRLIRLKAIVLDKMGKREDALRECDTLINQDMGDGYEFYLLKNRFLCDYVRKIDNIRAYIKRNPYDFRAYELITDYEFRLVSNSFSTTTELHDQLLKDLDDGIRYNPSYNNECLSRKFDYLIEKRAVVCSDWKHQISIMMKTIEEQDPHCPLLYRMRLEYKKEIEANCEDSELGYSQVWDEIVHGITEEKWSFRRYLSILLELLDVSKGNWSNRCAFISDEIKKNEWQFHSSHSFLSMVVGFFLYKKRNLGRAFTYLKQMPEDSYEREDVYALLDIIELSKVGERRAESQELYRKVVKGFSKYTQKEFDKHQAERRCKYAEVLNLVNELRKEERYEHERFTEEMHARLWQGDFQTVYDTSQNLLKDEYDWTGRGANVINYQIARSKLGHKVKKDKLDKLISDAPDSEIKAAALLLMGNEMKACDILRNVISHNLERALSCKSDYIFQQMAGVGLKNVINEACKVEDL